MQHASPEPKHNKQVVTLAVKQNGLALEFASNSRIKNNKRIMTAAVTGGCGYALQHAFRNLKNSKLVVTIAVKEEGKTL